MKKGDDQDVSGESIGKELDKVDAKKNPQKVVQLVNSVTSIINYGNKSDTGGRDERTKVNLCCVLLVTYSMRAYFKGGGKGEFDIERRLEQGRAG